MKHFFILNRLDFENFLSSIGNEPLRVLDASVKNENYIPLDLSENNLELSTVDVSSVSKLGDYINLQIKKHNGIVAFGGYLEVRNIYKRSHYFNDTNSNNERTFI